MTPSKRAKEHKQKPNIVMIIVVLLLCIIFGYGFGLLITHFI